MTYAGCSNLLPYKCLPNGSYAKNSGIPYLHYVFIKKQSGKPIKYPYAAMSTTNIMAY